MGYGVPLTENALENAEEGLAVLVLRLFIPLSFKARSEAYVRACVHPIQWQIAHEKIIFHPKMLKSFVITYLEQITRMPKAWVLVALKLKAHAIQNACGHLTSYVVLGNDFDGFYAFAQEFGAFLVIP